MSARTLRILPFPTDPLKVFLDHVRTCLCRKRCHQPRHPPRD